MVGTGHEIERILPVCCSDELLQDGRSSEDDEMSLYGFSSSRKERLNRKVSVTVDSRERKQRMMLSHEAIKVLVRLLQQFDFKGLVLKLR